MLPLIGLQRGDMFSRFRTEFCDSLIHRQRENGMCVVYTPEKFTLYVWKSVKKEAHICERMNSSFYATGNSPC